MGWTSYHADHYRKDGSVDRKAECDGYFLEGLNRGHYRVLKSAMDGCTYYAAVQHLLKYTGMGEDGKPCYEPAPEDEPVFAAVFITATDRREYENFSYKNMTEDMGPYRYGCPVAILDLLSPTDNAYALEWRKRCRDAAASRKDPGSLRNLPVGTRIQFELGGKTYDALKHRPAYQYKRPFWLIVPDFLHISASKIPKTFKVVGHEV